MTIQEPNQETVIHNYKANLFLPATGKFKNIDQTSDRDLKGFYEKMVRRYGHEFEIKMVWDMSTREEYTAEDYANDQKSVEETKHDKLLYREEKEREALDAEAKRVADGGGQDTGVKLPAEPGKFLVYVRYIINTGQVPLPVEAFDDDWEPAGYMIRPVLLALGWITEREDGIRLTDAGRGALPGE